MVNDAVDQRGSASGVREDGGPLAEGEVGREHEAAAFVAAADDLKQEVGVARVVGQVANLVDAEQRALLIAMLDALRADVDSEPYPELISLDAACSAVAAR